MACRFDLGDTCDRLHARIRVLKIFDACNQRTAITFMDDVVNRLPFRVQVVQTDNGAEFQSQFHWHLESRDIRHVYIRPHTPRLNGKVELHGTTWGTSMTKRVDSSRSKIPSPETVTYVFGIDLQVVASPTGFEPVF